MIVMERAAAPHVAPMRTGLATRIGALRPSTPLVKPFDPQRNRHFREQLWARRVFIRHHQRCDPERSENGHWAQCCESCMPGR